MLAENNIMVESIIEEIIANVRTKLGKDGTSEIMTEEQVGSRIPETLPAKRDLFPNKKQHQDTPITSMIENLVDELVETITEKANKNDGGRIPKILPAKFKPVPALKLQPDITTFFKPANLNNKQQEQVTNNTKHKITKITGNKITKSNKNPKENPKTVEKRRGYWTNLAKKKKEQEETKKQEDEIVKIRDENNSSDNNLSDQSAQLLQVPGREGSTSQYNLADDVTGSRTFQL